MAHTEFFTCIDDGMSTPVGSEESDNGGGDAFSSDSMLLAPLSEKEVKVKFQSKQFQNAVMKCIEDTGPPSEIMIKVVVAINGDSAIYLMDPEPPDPDVKECIKKTAVHLKFRKISKKTGVKWTFKTKATGPSNWKAATEKTTTPVVDSPEAVAGTYSGSENPAQVDASCDPVCRTGYVCKAGVCVSLCNPPCPDGYHCTPDGTDCIPSV